MDKLDKAIVSEIIWKKLTISTLNDVLGDKQITTDSKTRLEVL